MLGWFPFLLHAKRSAKLLNKEKKFLAEVAAQRTFLVDNPATILYSITWDANHSRWRDPSEYGSSPQSPQRCAVNTPEADFLVQRKIIYYFDLVLDKVCKRLLNYK